MFAPGMPKIAVTPSSSITWTAASMQGILGMSIDPYYVECRDCIPGPEGALGGDVGEDLARVHDPARVERALDPPHCVERRAVLPGHERRPGRPDAVLSGRRAAEPQRQLVDLVGDLEDARDLVLVAGVDQVAGVEIAAADVAVGRD